MTLEYPTTIVGIEPSSVYCSSIEPFDLYFRSHLESNFSNVPEPLYIYRRIGHTKSFGKLATIIYYETLTLLRHGFKMGLPFITLFGLMCMIPRLFGHAIKFAIGSKISLVSSQGLGAARCEDIRAMKEALAVVTKVEVPLKNQK